MSHCNTATCPNPVVPANGNIKRSSGNEIDNYIEYECNGGFELTGGAIAICTATVSGPSFQPDPPICQRKCVDIIIAGHSVSPWFVNGRVKAV